MSGWLVLCNVIAGMLIAVLWPSLLSDMPPTEHSTIDSLIIASLEASVIYFVLSQQSGVWLKRTGLLFVCYWGIKYLLLIIEALFFLNLWQSNPLMSLTSIIFLLVFSFLVCLLFCPLATRLTTGNSPNSSVKLHLNNALKPIFQTAIVYVPIYFLAGMFIAIPLGGEAFKSTYATLEVPYWMPVFQLARGILWATIIWLLFNSLAQNRTIAFSIPAMLWLLSCAQLLASNPYMDTQLRYAHLVEMSVSMLIFGVVATWFFRRRVAQCYGSSVQSQ